MVPPDSFWPGGHTQIRGKLPLLGHKPSCCTSTWPSCSLLRGRSHIMAPRLKNRFVFNVNSMSFSVWFRVINRQQWALSGWGIYLPVLFGLCTDVFVLRTLRNSFGYWHEKAQKSFSLHSFLWRPEKVESQNDQKKGFNFWVECEHPNLSDFQGYYKSSIWVSKPYCLLFFDIKKHSHIQLLRIQLCESIFFSFIFILKESGDSFQTCLW